MSQNVPKGELSPSVPGFFSVEGVFTLRHLVVMGMMAALTVVFSLLSVFLTPTFKALSFDYLPGVIVSVFYGPWAALCFGLVSDTVGYFANPQGGYFFGYALSAMVSNFLYACFLYRRPVRIWRVAAARALVVIIVAFGLNFLWTHMMYGAAASKYFSAARIINNLIQFPFHVALIALVTRYLPKIPPVAHMLES